MNSRALNRNSGEWGYLSTRRKGTRQKAWAYPQALRRVLPQTGGPRGCWHGSCLQLCCLAAVWHHLQPSESSDETPRYLAPHLHSWQHSPPTQSGAAGACGMSGQTRDVLRSVTCPQTPNNCMLSNCFSIHASRYCCYLKLVCIDQQN